MADDGIELADAVQAVRDEPITAAGRSTGQDLVFEPGDIQPEFPVELRKEAAGSLWGKAYAFEAGMDGRGARTHTHRVAVTLKALDARTGEPWKVSNGSRGTTARFGRSGRA
ncbi:trypco2 family protein [Streptomyces sp. CA-251387]|uniref:trypco2 family protein n=1 Tax=Streptomyces sp. CA-251387 TaxID=3240064 RepID=UPI003D9484C9